MAFVRIFGLLKFTLGNKISGIWKTRNNFALSLCLAVAQSSIPARVIEMQMRVDDNRDVIRRVTCYFKQTFGKRFDAENSVHLRLFFSPFFADTGFDQDFFGWSFYEQTVHI